MARPRAHVGEAQLLEKLSNVALVEVDAEALGDNPLEVDPPPARHAVPLAIRPGFDEIGQLPGRQARLETLRSIAEETLRPGCVEAVDPIAQRLPVHASDPTSQLSLGSGPDLPLRFSSTGI